MFILSGTGPEHLTRKLYEYDTHFNPFAIFKQRGRPGIFSNYNNIIKVNIYRYEPTPGDDDYSETAHSYEYNESGYPVKDYDGEEYIYD